MSLGITSRGIIGQFFKRLQTEMAAQWWPSIAMAFESDQASETYKWLGMVPAVREWKGDLALKQLRENSLTIANKTWERRSRSTPTTCAATRPARSWSASTSWPAAWPTTPAS